MAQLGLCLGSHKAKIKVLAGLGSYLESTCKLNQVVGKIQFLVFAGWRSPFSAWLWLWEGSAFSFCRLPTFLDIFKPAIVCWIFLLLWISFTSLHSSTYISVWWNYLGRSSLEFYLPQKIVDFLFDPWINYKHVFKFTNVWVLGPIFPLSICNFIAVSSIYICWISLCV